MSERKVLQKYYPPDFDPRVISRRRGPKKSGPRMQTVRLMAPFSMRCTTCGEFIYKGRTFNSRKVTDAEERYLNIQIFFFHIKCTRCSAEIIFRTDPKNNDYAMVRGAVRNMEPWRNRATENETMEERLTRLEKEEAEAAGEEEKNAMADLEAKNEDAKLEMAAADALDEIRHRNARINRSEKEGADFAENLLRSEEEERARQEREDEEAAKKAFEAARATPTVAGTDGTTEDAGSLEQRKAGAPSQSFSGFGEDNPGAVTTAAPTTFQRVVKKKQKKDHSALLGIKKKAALV